MNRVESRVVRTAILALFLASGATSLVYEVLWLRQLILIFGSTLFATSTVLAAFMGGLALGAYGAGRLLVRRAPSPAILYGLLEIGIGLYALIVPLLFRLLSPIYGVVWNAGGSDSFLLMSLAKFAGIALVLVPPTALMGASLPVLARQIADDPERIGGRVGTLYATNTFGAVAGVLLAGFFAIPWIGVHRTLQCAAAVNIAVGLAAIVLGMRLRRGTRAPAPGPPGPEAPAGDPLPAGRVRIALVAFALSGFGAMVLEVAWTRGLSLVIGSSVYAFALMLLAFLIGLASGSAVFSGWLSRRRAVAPETLLAILLASAGFFAYLTAFLLQSLPRLFAEAYLRLHPSASAMIGIELLLGLLIMFPTTFLLGGIFPTVLQIHARGLQSVSASVGTVYASNALGTIVGSFAGGFVLIPFLGVRDTLVAISLLEVVLGFWVAWGAPRSAIVPRSVLLTLMAIAAMLIAVLRPGWDALLMNSGVYYYIQDIAEEGGWKAFAAKAYDDRNVVYLAEGLTSTVLVMDQPRYKNRYLSVNGKVEASSSSDLETQLLISHIPLLLHAAPKDVMIIGLASGISVGAAASHPVSGIRVVELEKAMVPAARLFSAFNGAALDDPRVTLSINDARNELEFSSKQYDVIVSEPSNPFMTVAANLFTEEFFQMARKRIRPGGMFSQWVQAYCLPPEDLRSIIAAFHAAFPKVMIFQIGGVDILLVGSDEPMRFDLDALRARMAELDVKIDLARVGIRDPFDLLPLFEMGDEEVDDFVKGASANTDDNARVEYSAPKAFDLHTTTLNYDMIDDHSAAPIDYVADSPETDEEIGRFYVGLGEAWLRRKEGFMAAEYAKYALGGPSDAAARALLARIPPGNDVKP